jgi:hypothetical protein
VHVDDIFRVEMTTIGYGDQTQDLSASSSTPSAPRTPVRPLRQYQLSAQHQEVQEQP